jgi:hypothetical protein
MVLSICNDLLKTRIDCAHSLINNRSERFPVCLEIFHHLFLTAKMEASPLASPSLNSSARIGESSRPICRTKSVTQSESDGEGLRSRAEVDPLSIKSSDPSALISRQLIENFSFDGTFHARIMTDTWKHFSLRNGRSV